MKANPVTWLMLGALLAASACARTTSVGAAGPGQDADAADATDAGIDTSDGAGDGAISQDADAAPASAELCASSGGTVTTGSCCANGVDSFPDSCAVGACGCSPASSRSITICGCPTGACFAPGLGCVGPQVACTEGMDLTCDEDAAVTAPRGRCVTGGRCLCSPGATLTSTGKCL